MKKCIYTVLLCLNSILTVALILFFGLIQTYVDMYLPLGAALVFPILTLIILICEFVLLSMGISRLLSKFKLRRILGTLISLVLLGTVLFVPYTKAFGTLYYKANDDLRREFVESLHSNLNNQTDVNTYFIGDTRISYTGEVTVDIKDEVTKVMFGVYLGLDRKIVLIYTSDDKVEKTDFMEGCPYGFYLEFKNLEKLDDNWWLATIY